MASPDPYVLMRLEGVGTFAEVPLLPGDTVARLAGRACAKFERSWGVDATQVALHLVAPGGQQEEPAEAAVPGSRLGVGLPLERAGVTSGAWLLAKLVAVPAAAAAPAPGGGCLSGAAAADPVALLAAVYPAALPERQAELLRHHDAFAGDRSILAARDFAARHLPGLLRRLQGVVATTTRRRLASSTGIALPFSAVAK